MGNMSHQHMLWRKQLKNSRNRIKTSAGDALVTAASVCYFGPLEDKYRNDLLQDWIEKCQHGDFFPRFKFGSIDAVLNDKLKTLIDVSGDFELSNPHSRDSQKRKEASNCGLIPIKTFSYHPTMFDAGANIKSKMKMADGDEDVTPADLVDSEPEDEQSPLVTRPGFTLQDVLSDFRELSDWRIKDLPSDLHSLQNAFIIRVSCHNRKYCWPLLIDPDNQAELWVRALHESKNIFCERDVVAGGQDGLPGGRL